MRGRSHRGRHVEGYPDVAALFCSRLGELTGPSVWGGAEPPAVNGRLAVGKPQRNRLRPNATPGGQDMAGNTGRVRRLLVSLVAAGALAAPVGWISVASATPSPDPDDNGDVHSNCHTGSKMRGAGGEDNGPGNPKDTSDADDCPAAPVPPAAPEAPKAAPQAPKAAPQGPAAAPARAPAPAAAAAVQAAPRVTG
jgi:hypothetical protein